MKSIGVLSLVFIILAGCNQKPDKPIADLQVMALAENNAVEAVEDSSFYSGSLKLRYPDDEVQNLYEALLEKNKSLRLMEASISEIQDKAQKKQQRWQKFLAKNQDYYLDARRHAEMISDSAMRTTTLMELDQSERAFSEQRSKNERRWSKVEGFLMALKDNQKALKVRLTIPIIESYQSGKGTSVANVESMVGEQMQLLDEMEALLKST